MTMREQLQEGQDHRRVTVQTYRYSEDEDSEGEEKSDGELVVLTD